MERPGNPVFALFKPGKLNQGFAPAFSNPSQAGLGTKSLDRTIQALGMAPLMPAPVPAYTQQDIEPIFAPMLQGRGHGQVPDLV